MPPVTKEPPVRAGPPVLVPWLVDLVRQVAHPPVALRAPVALGASLAERDPIAALQSMARPVAQRAVVYPRALLLRAARVANASSQVSRVARTRAQSAIPESLHRKRPQPALAGAAEVEISQVLAVTAVLVVAVVGEVAAARVSLHPAVPVAQAARH